jgi:hypothetical protein
MHGLFGRGKRGDEGAFLSLEQTQADARDMSIALRTKHLEDKLIPCRWDLQPVYTMLDTGIWDDPCRKRLEDFLAHPSALDGLTLMLFGHNFGTDKATIEKMCSYEIYIKQVSERLNSPSIKDAHQSVQEALRKAQLNL